MTDAEQLAEIKALIRPLVPEIHHPLVEHAGALTSVAWLIQNYLFTRKSLDSFFRDEAIAKAKLN